MVIKRMLGSSALARELARVHETMGHENAGRENMRLVTLKQPATATPDSSFLLYGPAIWDGLEEAEFQESLVQIYPFEGERKLH